MLRKGIVLVLALFLVAGAAVGVNAALAQEVEDSAVPSVPDPGRYGPGHMWQQEDGAQLYGPGHMWQWRQDGGQPSGPGYGRMGGWMMAGNTLPEVAAEVLGLTVEEVWAELATGISLAELAANHGTDAQAIIDAFAEAHAASLQEAVEAGWLTQEQADWMQESMLATIEARVNQPWGSGFGPGNGWGYGLGGCHRFGGAGADGSGFAPRGRGMGGHGWGSGWQQPAAPQGPNA